MNKRKWSKPEVPLTHLAMKLGEETGETISEILDTADIHFADGEKLKAIETEARHVLFIASIIANRAKQLRGEL